MTELANHSANSAADFEPRKPGRPKGSKNKATINGRAFYGRHAKKLAPKLIKRALEELDKPDGDLAFAEKVGSMASAYAWGKPVQTQELSGPEGTPITVDGMMPTEVQQRLGALFLAWKQAAQQQDGGHAGD